MRSALFLLLFAGCGNSSQPSCDPAASVCAHPTLTTLSLLAGQPGGPGWVDGVGAAAHFTDPWTMARDAAAGRIYLADGMTLRMVDIASATVSTLGGSYGVTGGMDGPVAQATFNTPSGLQLGNGQLYLTDTENHSIRKVDLASGVVSTIGGQFEQPGAVDAVGTAARFQEPEGLALDAGAGNLYIGDTDNSTIRVMSLASGMVTTLAGTARMSGNADGVGAAALFNKPKAMALDGGDLYVIDALNNSIRKVEVASATVSTLVTFATEPQGLALDGSALLVSLGDHTVTSVDLASGAITIVCGTSGMQGFVDGTAANARLNNPAGLLNDGAGTVYLADEDNAALRTISLADGTVTTFAGAKSPGSADGTAGDARFFSPQGIAAGDDVLYLADTSNATIRKVVVSTGLVTTVAGAAGQPGLADGTAGDARFNGPIGVALDEPSQLLYVADGGNRTLRRIDLGSGAVSTLVFQAAPGDKFARLVAPSGLALERDQLFITDYSNDVVLALDLKKALISTLAGKSGTPGGVDGIGGAATFYGPLGIAADGRGSLFVADDLNDSVRKVVIVSGAVTTIAGLVATPGTDDGTGSAARFQYPAGITANGLGELWIADSINNIVRHVDVASGVVTTVVGTLHEQGVLLGPLPSQLTQPVTLTLTPTGLLAVVSENSVLMAK